MSPSLQQLWLYNDWANQLLVTTFKQEPKALPLSCQHLLCHIMNAQSIWASRITGTKPDIGVWEDYSLADCEKYHQRSSAALGQVIAEYNDDMQVRVTYTNTKNESFTNDLRDILLHIFNHATYHRAQIAMDMRKNGLEPINTDYILFARQADLPSV